jgi:hypothetical protein
LAGQEANASHRERIRTLNRRRQAKQRHAEDDALAPAAAEPACLLPPWLQEALDLNTATLGLDAQPARRRRDGYTKPSPLSDRAAALLQEHPTWNAQRVAAEAGCSKSLAERVRRRVREERNA